MKHPHFEDYRQRDKREWREEIEEHVRQCDAQRAALEGKRILEV